METPDLDYNYWLNGWNNAIGNATAYSNINIIPWSNFQGTLLQCEVEILDITNIENLSDADIFRAIDLINQWGGKTSRMFYAIRQNQTISYRELVMQNPNLNYYKEGIMLSRANNFDAVNSFLRVDGIGLSFMAKHAQFWSAFNMAILDMKIAFVLGFLTPAQLLANYSYEEFMNHMIGITGANNLNSVVHAERAMFCFHSNYFQNDNTRFKSNITDFTNLRYAIYLAELFNIAVPQYLRDRL